MHQRLLLTVIVCILGFCSTVIGSGGLLPGLGTVDSPYRIEDKADFDVFSANADYPDTDYWAIGVYVKLTAPIDLSATLYPAAVIAPDTDPDDLVFDGKQYSGIFDGNDQPISGMTIQATGGTDYLGLFGFAQNALIENVVLVNTSITSTDGSIYTGTLCGYNGQCKIVNSNAVSNINLGGTCDYAGGLVGYNDESQIFDSFATGQVQTQGSNAGGFCGYNHLSAIDACYAKVQVSGQNQVGGFIGYNNDFISNCYGRGDANGVDAIGGFCGENNEGEILYCYSTGKPAGSEQIGGFCAINNGMINDCFWDTTTSKTTTSAGGSGKETSVMYMSSNYHSAGWIFIETFGHAGMWHMPYQTSGYPMLFHQKDVPGDVTGWYGVDIEDYLQFSQSWQSQSGQTAFNPNCDLEQINTPGQIVIDDVAIFFNHWLAGIN